MDTTTTMSWVTDWTCENRNKTVANNREHWEVSNHIRVIREDPVPCDVFDFMGDSGTPCQQTRFMRGKEIRNIEDRNVNDFYMDAYQDYDSRKSKIVKPTRKWNASTNKPKEFKFLANTNQNTPHDGVFVFGSTTQKKDIS